ncbi:MAG: hypothetical protein ACQR33_05655 [Candidatus Saccharibacteria bacterium]
METRRYTFSIDNATAEWYQYHFDDALLRNDVSWRTWRLALQRRLNPKQLEGQACGVCGIDIAEETPHGTEFLGGYRIVYCLAECESPLEKEIRETVESLEPGMTKPRVRHKK